MRKFFEEPTLEMTFFDAENVVITESAVTGEEKAATALENEGISADKQISLTLVL